MLLLSHFRRGDTPTTPVRASPPPKLLGRYPFVSSSLPLCIPSATGAAAGLVAALHQREPLSPLDPAVWSVNQGRHDVPELNRPQERVWRLRVLIRPVLSHGVVDDAKDVTVQARVRQTNCGCTFFLVAKRCGRSFKETASNGGPTPGLFWSHPYQSRRLRRSTSPVPSLLIRAIRFQDPYPLGPLPAMRPVSSTELRC